MEEARASWNTRFVTSQGFDCQITLRDDDEKELVKRAGEVMQGILSRGGNPTGGKSTQPVEDQGLGKCPNCGKPLRWVDRKDGSGRFQSCSGFPTCKYIKPPEEKTDSHLCTIHNVEMYKRGQMKSYSHPIDLENGDTGWCDGKEMRIAPRKD